MEENHYQKNFASLRHKILVAMIVAPAIPFLLVVLVGYYYFTSSLEREVFSRMVRISEDHERAIEMFLSERKSDLVFIANSTRFDDIRRPGQLKRVLENLKVKSPAYVDLGVFDEGGVHLAYQGPFQQLEGKVYRDVEWFRTVMARSYYISDVFLGFRRVPHFIIAVAVKQNGKTWVLRATIDTMLFTELVEKVRIGKTGEAYVINQAGEFQTEPRSGGVLLELDPDRPMPATRHKGVRTYVATNHLGESFIYATTWLGDMDWQLVVRQAEDDAFRDLQIAAYLVIIIIIAGGAAIVVMAFIITANLTNRLAQTDEEKSRLNQQLIVATRLAEIGEMSAGFAHEINNPLQIIRAEQTLIETIIEEMISRGDLRKSEDLDEMVDSISQIKLQVERCGNITQSILKFARQKDPMPLPINLQKFITDVISMVEKKAAVNGITLETKFPPHIPMVNVDPGQLQQVLLNLINNAFDAVTEKNGNQGGRVEVIVGADDTRVMISVKDNGVGISQENLERIFTPFFTTKPVGKGTGLGLSVCFGIVDKMGGSMEVSSQFNHGTTFNVSLPPHQNSGVKNAL